MSPHVDACRVLTPLELAGALTLIWVLILRLLRRNIVAFWLAALPGVILHEMTHWMVAFATFGRPGFPRFIPKKMGNAYALGRVPIHNPRWFNGALIGLSPLLLMPLAYAVIVYGTPGRFSWLGGWQFILTPLIAAECLLECIPSRPDLRLVSLSAIPLGIVGVMAYLFWVR